MKTRIEKIKDAYGEFYDRCSPNINGWSNYPYWEDLDDPIWFFNIEDHPSDYSNLWRPAELEGLDDNNGWVSVQEFGWPKETGYYDFAYLDILISYNIYYAPEFVLVNSSHTHWRPVDTRMPSHI